MRGFKITSVLSSPVFLLSALIFAATFVSSHAASSLQSNSTSSSHLQNRDVIPSRIIQFKGALLFKNGYQTTCEVALMSLTSGFVAASCLDWSGKSLNSTTIYQVYLDNSSDGTATIVSVLSTSNIHVHPGFNPVNYQNNIAVIEFDTDNTQKFRSYIAYNGITNNTQAYVERTLDTEASLWNIPVVNNRGTADVSDDMAACKVASGLFSTNSDWMTCTSASTMSMFNRTCRMPFGTMYSQQGTDVILSALYSHSIVFTENMCVSSPIFYNYYTQLWPYVGFAAQVLDTSINIYKDGKTDVWTTPTILSMNAPTTVTNIKSHIVYGDIYARQGVVQKPVGLNAFSSSTAATITATGSRSDIDGDSADSLDDADSDSESPDPTSADGQHQQTPTPSVYVTDGSITITITPTPDASAAGSQQITQKDEGTPGLSKSQKIIIGVVVPLTVIPSAIGLFILYNYWRARKQDRAWNPYEQKEQLQIMALELGGVDQRHASVAPIMTDDKVYRMLGINHNQK
ncbi:hypothetical protein BX070DRAFT_254543 [Coemansia spiralis]|nr:hypothetical protein BX070DRAFT_254543 [Coemansia spiralis]